MKRNLAYESTTDQFSVSLPPTVMEMTGVS